MEVLVKDHCDVIVAECPKLIAAYQVESEWLFVCSLCAFLTVDESI